MGVKVERKHPKAETLFNVTGIFPAVVINQGEVVSLTAEAVVLVSYPATGEEDAIDEFRNSGPLRAKGDGPWVNPKTAVAFIVKEVEDDEG
jgi:hypothetical protein